MPSNSFLSRSCVRDEISTEIMKKHGNNTHKRNGRASNRTKQFHEIICLVKLIFPLFFGRCCRWFCANVHRFSSLWTIVKCAILSKHTIKANHLVKRKNGFELQTVAQTDGPTGLEPNNNKYYFLIHFNINGFCTRFLLPWRIAYAYTEWRDVLRIFEQLNWHVNEACPFIEWNEVLKCITLFVDSPIKWFDHL